MNYKQFIKNHTESGTKSIFGSTPISAQFIETKKVEPKPLIRPTAGPQNYNDKDRAEVER